MIAKTNGWVTLADGTRIFYQVEGPQDGDWIILSNSLATDIRVWDPQMALLCKSKRVLRYDTRGHGASEASPAPYSFPQLTADLIALMDHLSIDKADIMGISLGGMTALAMGISYPERIGHIVCCDARADAPDPYKAIWDANIARLHADGIAALCEPTLERWFTPGFLASPANKEAIDVVCAMVNATSPHGYEGVARCLQSLNLAGDLANLNHPILYITGEFDMAAPVAVMQGMADATPNGHMTVLKDAAHLSNLEQPQQFIDAITPFLELRG